MKIWVIDLSVGKKQKSHKEQCAGATCTFKCLAHLVNVLLAEVYRQSKITLNVIILLKAFSNIFDEKKLK